MTEHAEFRSVARQGKPVGGGSVLNDDYATTIARDWSTNDPATRYIGYPLRCELEADYVSRSDPQRRRRRQRRAVSACDELHNFNDHAVEHIEVVAEHRGPNKRSA